MLIPRILEKIETIPPIPPKRLIAYVPKLINFLFFIFITTTLSPSLDGADAINKRRSVPPQNVAYTIGMMPCNFRIGLTVSFDGILGSF